MRDINYDKIRADLLALPKEDQERILDELKAPSTDSIFGDDFPTWD